MAIPQKRNDKPTRHNIKADYQRYPRQTNPLGIHGSNNMSKPLLPGEYSDPEGYNSDEWYNPGLTFEQRLSTMHPAGYWLEHLRNSWGHDDTFGQEAMYDE